MTAAIVTGVSRPEGIGAAIAARLAAGGMRLFLTGWPDGEDGGGAQIRDELRAGGATVEYLEADLADPEAPAQVVAAAREALGPVGVLIANHARSARQTLAELTAAELDLSFAVNARATLLLARHVAAQHEPPDPGRIVFFTSGQYHGAMPEELPYIASKAVVQQLTASLAVELAPRGVTVNCVDPGPNDTGWASGALHRQVADAMPAGRWGRPADAARLVAFLCSPEADWITGQTIASDGGWSALGAG